MAAHDFHSVVDPFQILAVNRRGVLRKVQCPFRVLCKEAVGSLEVNRFYEVVMVSQGHNKVCYYIEDRTYPHTHFCLFIS
jgi:hypothetical protein